MFSNPGRTAKRASLGSKALNVSHLFTLSVISLTTNQKVKSFLTQKDAMDFVAGKVVRGPSASSKPQEQKFYGVAVGKKPGVYEDWVDAQKQIAGVKGPKYKKFPTRAEAEAFVKSGGGSSIPIRTPVEKVRTMAKEGKPKREKSIEDEYEEEFEHFAKRARTSSVSVKEEVSTQGKEIVVFTDGSSLGNGKSNARAGVGVFFGENDPRYVTSDYSRATYLLFPRNVSEPLAGMPQTNQRAELTALLRALEIVPQTQNIKIVTDSNYSINSCNVWYKRWAENGWRNSRDEVVMNQDIIKAVRALIEERDKKGVRTNFEWIKGHSNDPSNEAADRLAVAGAHGLRL